MSFVWAVARPIRFRSMVEWVGSLDYWLFRDGKGRASDRTKLIQPRNALLTSSSKEGPL